MDDAKPVFTVSVRVGVDIIGGAMCRPAGMPDTDRAVEVKC